MWSNYPEILKIWISRSRNHGFSFIVGWTIGNERFLGDYDTAAIGATIDVLVQNCAKWQSISVDAQLEAPGNFMNQILSVIPQGKAKIQQICVDRAEFAIDKLFTFPLVHLTHLTIYTYARNYPIRSYALMENLLSLSLSANNFDIMRLLSQAPRLRRAKLHVKLAPGEAYPSASIAMTYLHTLDLKVAAGAGEDTPDVLDPRFCRFLGCLCLPALKTLFIDIGGGDARPLRWSGVVDLLLRSEASLENLEMRSFAIASFTQFLEGLPDLKHLAITDPILIQDEKLICRLIYDPLPSTNVHARLCQNLESLRITCPIFGSTGLRFLLRSVIDVSTFEGARTLVLVVPNGTEISGLQSLPPGSSLKIVKDWDWKVQRKDLYEEFGANWWNTELQS
ncbi:hypothetical protein BD410DRAFT_807237 [Rickenella mellea]|uniref:F-box domain-containing protein n=1 Tax=Rickenella mellea TaxID=50990 RepID=A0A4Y7PSG5_9AGAM|nr:hypothetical protein BD410DRAFT_807237 [Rickenella mellea]